MFTNKEPPWMNANKEPLV